VHAITLIEALDHALPGFAAYVVSDENLFRPPDTVSSVWCACSFFVRERPVAEPSWKAIADIVNSWASGPDRDLANDVYACFIENLAAPDHPLRPLLNADALSIWKQWEKLRRTSSSYRSVSANPACFTRCRNNPFFSG
jgi:hypothetical protein